MENVSEISIAVLRQLETLWNEQSILDFNVKINDSVIGCHRVILGACSEFFGCLFRSNMKETKENMVTLAGITVETFELILKSVYTGVNVLTGDNLIDIWLAVDQLQIDFMINICEKFAVNIISLNNFDKIHKTAQLLNSKPVLDSSRKFMRNTSVTLLQ